MVANECQIVLGTAAMEITREPVAGNTPELILKNQITGVFATEINEKAQFAAAEQQNWLYRWPVMTIVTIQMSDGNYFNVELQEVTNQATWSTGDLAGQQACVDDINTWLGT